VTAVAPRDLPLPIALAAPAPAGAGPAGDAEARRVAALAAWRRRRNLEGVLLTIAGVVLFLVGVYLIRDRPVAGYTVGAAGTLALCFGVLSAKFAASGPFPPHLLPDRGEDPVPGPEDFR